MDHVIDKRFSALTDKHRQLAGVMVLGHDTEAAPSNDELDALIKAKFLKEFRLADAFLLAAEAGSLDAAQRGNALILPELEKLADKGIKYMQIAGEHQYEVLDIETERAHPKLSDLGIDTTDSRNALAGALHNAMEATLSLYETSLEYYEQLLSHKNLANIFAPIDENGLIVANVNAGLTIECEEYRADYTYMRNLRNDLAL